MESDHYNDQAIIGGCSVPVRVNRKSKAEPTTVNVNGILIGSSDVVIFAGPCAVESHEQLLETAKKAVEMAIEEGEEKAIAWIAAMQKDTING